MIARAGPPSVHCLALAGVSVLLLAAAAVLPVDAPVLDFFACPLRAATGLPCFGCGFTHAFQYTVRGRAIDALSASPLGTSLAIGAAVHVVWTSLRLCGLPWAPRVVLGARARIACALLLAANWAFVALRARP